MVSTRRSIKAEPFDDTPIDFVPVSRAHTISSSSTPLPEPVMSSGDTTVADDTLMADMAPDNTPHGSSDGTMDVDDTIPATSTPAVSQATQPLPQRRQLTINGNVGSSTAGPAHRHDALHALTADSHDLIKAIQNLSALNIQATIPSLPKFVVVGDQSAGKSSIIEACCDITLPRSEGTCTRCPFEITTSALTNGVDSWKCTISLISDYAYLTDRPPQQPFGHWHAVEKRVIPFTVVTRKSELEHHLKLAQLAILNPDTDPIAYTTLNDISHTTRKVAFSPNVIRLDVQAPHLPELSFFDLPGAINVHEDAKEQHLVTFIKHLIGSYLSNKQALILLTCAANQDVQNSTAYKFVYKNNAKDRCIGVLTKLDLMYPSKIPEIEAMLDGKLFELPQGSWFITKQPSPAQLERGISHDEGRIQERDFFSKSPWADIGRRFKHQIGISNLQSAISKLYAQHISSHLPEISSRVEKRLQEVDVALAGFAATPKHAALTIGMEIQSVVTAIEKQILTGGRYDKERKDIMSAFVSQMQKQRPDIDWKTPGYVEPVLSVDDSSDEDATPSSKAVATPTPAPKTRPDAAPASSAVKRRAPASTFATPSKKPKTETAPPSTPQLRKVNFTLAQVKNEYDAREDAFAGPDVNVTMKLMQSTLCGWDTITDTLLTSLRTSTQKMLTAALRETLASRLHTEFYHACHRLLNNMATKLYATVSEALHHALACEQYRPVSISGLLLNQSSTTRAVLAELQRDRLKTRVQEYFDTADAALAKYRKTPIKDREKRAAEPAWLAANPDPCDTTVRHLAAILTYYDVACNRFVDSAAARHAYDVLRVLKESVGDELRKYLPVGNEADCQALLTEDAGRERVRVGLVKEREKLVKAKAELDGLRMR